MLKQGLAARARGFEPPVVVDISDGTVDGAPVIVALVHECDPSAKPCRVASTGKAYLRGYDGDFQLSHLEEQAFIAARKPPMFDRAPVGGAVFADLDPELVDAYVQSVRRGEPEGLGKFEDQKELLRRACVITADGVPTVAGILALGLYPQQFFPRFVIQAAAEPLQSAPAASRARNQAKIAGPIPHMLDQAMEWARRTFDTFIVSEADGSVRDHYAYPLIAFRELVVMLSQRSSTPAPPSASPVPATPSLSGRDQLIFDALATGPRTISELAAQTRLSADAVRRGLKALRERGLVRQDGGRGRVTVYQRA